ncbi:helix-turn-helix transcriptional regulator [Sphingomonas sp. LaA6.9]|uniref:helix-turn-helix transcriptional regulator n=1 Tax=Sphingomonas sp. LaA6.9 TaxID=2919914 RepID=UPI001F4FA046|nr:helix-turn-helix transcriptional regulator [Sphingomonas sp. LaA6.9]MCJ8157933.1 helix-turn-helix transcriptional regulator [Sphingomonas sp. LaA6.9]
MAAPLNDNGWENALGQLASATRSERGQLLAVGGPREIPFNCVTNAPSASWTEEFAEIGGGSAKVNWRIKCVRDPLVVMSEAHYAAARRGMDCEIYDDFASHYDMLHGCQTVLVNEKNRFFGLAALRTRADGKTSDADRAIFAAIAPSAQAAIRMQYALEHQGAVLMAGALEALGTAAFICDAAGQVGALTPAAEAAARTRSGLRLHRRRLSALRPDDDRAFQRALGDALRGSKPAPEPAKLWLRGSDGPLSGQICEIFALPGKPWSFGFDPRVLVTLRKRSELDDAHRDLLAEILGLSAAEADVTIMVASGISRDEIGVRRGSSGQTVNSQLKSIFRKSGVSREAELVALTHRLLQR